MTRATGQGRARRDDVERQVLQAVEDLLGEGEHYTTLGVGRIADRAGLTRTNFYFYFRDKTDLLLTLMESVTGSVFDLAEAWVDTTQAGPHGLEELELTLTAVVDRWREHAPLMNACIEVASYDPVVADYWRARVSGVVGLLAARLRGQHAALPAGTDPDIAAALLVWGVERLTAEHIATHPDDPSRDRALAASVARMIWAVASS